MKFPQDELPDCCVVPFSQRLRSGKGKTESNRIKQTNTLLERKELEVRIFASTSMYRTRRSAQVS
jgi:hypothetical protein